MDADPGLGLLGPAIESGGRVIVRSRVTEAFGFLTRHEYCAPEHVSTRRTASDTDYVDGCAIFLRMAMLEQIGLFRDDFFLYFEETELCLRARDHGWRAAVTGATRVATRPMDEERNGRSFYMVRNSVLVARVRRRYRARTVLRHVVSLTLHLAHVRRQAPATYSRDVARGLVAGLVKTMGQAPLLAPDAGRTPRGDT
jgi:GT2 family glycosyltransferase